MVVYCNVDVISSELRKEIIKEFRNILDSLYQSQILYNQAVAMQGYITDEMLHKYMCVKRKKMNFTMMVLADCISIEGPLPESLL